MRLNKYRLKYYIAVLQTDGERKVWWQTQGQRRAEKQVQDTGRGGAQG